MLSFSIFSLSCNKSAFPRVNFSERLFSVRFRKKIRFFKEYVEKSADGNEISIFPLVLWYILPNKLHQALNNLAKIKNLLHSRPSKSRVLGINVGDIKARKWYLVVILLLYIGLITSFCLNISLLLRTYPKQNESSQTMTTLKSKGNFLSSFLSILVL